MGNERLRPHLVVNCVRCLTRRSLSLSACLCIYPSVCPSHFVLTSIGRWHMWSVFGYWNCRVWGRIVLYWIGFSFIYCHLRIPESEVQDIRKQTSKYGQGGVPCFVMDIMSWCRRKSENQSCKSRLLIVVEIRTVPRGVCGFLIGDYI